MVRRIKVGDIFEVKPAGTFVTVTRYTDTTCIEVKDSTGHARTVNAQALLTGRLHWRYKDGSLKYDLFTYEDVQAKIPVKKVRAKPKSNNYYVYMCSINGEIVYVGQGKDKRYQHCVSGVSHSRELNRALFMREPMIVEVYKQGLSREESLEIEASLIGQIKPVYNKQGK